MSQRIVSDPSQHGWVEVDGKWVWDATGGGSGQWEQNGDDIYYNDGNVGIGTDNPSPNGPLSIERDGANSTEFNISLTNGTNDKECVVNFGKDLSNSDRYRGRVFYQVDNDVMGFWTAATERMRIDSSGALTLQNTATTGWGATFSNDYGASGLLVRGTGGTLFGCSDSSRGYAFTVKNDGSVYIGASSNNINGGDAKLQVAGDGYFSGTVNANKFVGDGSGLTGVGGGLPDGDFTHNGKITATDFIATSDERVKDNITTAPVGLIDSLKGREWDWKESGEKGSGVVAQELEQVLPHLVQTDDDGMKSVAYNGLVAYLIEEVKALRAEVEALK